MTKECYYVMWLWLCRWACCCDGSVKLIRTSHVGWGGVYTRVQDQRNFKIEWSDWSGAWFGIQGVHTRVRVPVMGRTNEYMLTLHRFPVKILSVSTRENTPPSLRNQCSSLGSNLESESKVHLCGVLGPKFLGHGPWWKTRPKSHKVCGPTSTRWLIKRL